MTRPTHSSVSGRERLKKRGVTLASVARRERLKKRGFTLVELLMATTAGLMVSAAAFLLAKNASAVFQEETRITGAQLSASLGLHRLVSDISRAGFLTTPNIQTDPFVCNEAGSWPPALTDLRALRIIEGGSVLAHGGELGQSTSNGLNPDSITVAGSFHSAEMFPVRTIQTGGGGKTVYLETVNMPIARTCKGLTLVDCTPTLQQIFATGRILRILTPTGKQIFGVIGGLTAVGNSLAVQLMPAPTVPTVALNNNGYEGDCNYCLVNPISIVRYELQSLVGSAAYGALVAPVAASATGDDLRTELVRVELDQSLQPILATQELVAEFAVDLKFGISTVDQPASAVTDLAIADPANPLVYSTLPDRVRSVHVRFSTRARAPDRDVDLPGGPDGRKHRLRITAAGKPAFVRMRTLYSEVALDNLMRAKW